MTEPLHERLDEAAKGVAQITDGQWTAENSEVYDEGCDAHPIVSCECNTTCRSEEDQDRIAQYLAAVQPRNVAKLCEQVRVLKEALEGAYAMAIGHAATYKFQHGLDELHPMHKAILEDAREALKMAKESE